MNNGLPPNPLYITLGVSPNGTGGTNLFAGIDGRGVFLSTNNGTSWTAVNNGLPTSTYVYAFAVSPNGSGGTNLFAGTNSGVYLSTDNGTSWTAANNGFPINTYVGCFAVSTNGAGGTNLFAGTNNGVYLSTNNGTSWIAVNDGLPGTNIIALSISPNGTGGSNLFAGTGYSIFLSTNNGESWSVTNSGLAYVTGISDIVHINGSTTGKSNLFAVGSGLIYHSTNNGTSWQEVPSFFAYRINCLAVSPNDSGVTNLFAGAYYCCEGDGNSASVGVFLSTNYGISWSEVSNGFFGSYQGGVTALHAINNGSGGTILFANGAYRSTNNGINWTLMVHAFNCFASIGNNIFGGRFGGVYLSTNNGISWIPVNNGLPGTGIRSLAVNGVNLFAGTNNGIFLTTNNGANWKLVNTGLPDNALATSFAVVGSNIFANIDNEGVFLSTDNGENWMSVNNGLPDSTVTTIEITGAYIFAGTENSGIWRRPLSDFFLIGQINPPLNLNAQSIDSSFIKLTWQDNSADEEGFFIERTNTNDSTSWELIGAVSQNVNQYNDYLVTRGLQYYYRVYAYSDTVTSGYSNIDSAVLGGDPSLIPLTPTNLRVEKFRLTSAVLGWDDNSNNETGFIIFRKTDGDMFFKIIDSTVTDVMTYKELALRPGQDYFFKVCSFNQSGISDFSNTIFLNTQKGPVKSQLDNAGNITSENYPNPFNPKTTINYQLTNQSKVTLKIFDVLGKEILVLVNEMQDEGEHSVQWDASEYPSGVYFYKLVAREKDIIVTSIKRMILIK